MTGRCKSLKWQKTLPVLKNPLSEKLHAVMRQIQAERPRFLSFSIVRQQLDPLKETEFACLLAEDKMFDSMSYVDYLCAVHRNIQLEIYNH